MMCITDLETWSLDYSDQKIFNVRKRKHTFTPYEQYEKFCDENIYEDLGDYVLVECIELPDKDVLFGMSGTWEEDVRDEDNSLIGVERVVSDTIEYYKLSEIELMDVTKAR